MARRNQFKYRCDDCGATEYLPLIAFNRHNRPRCSSCGSTWLERTHDEAEAKVMRATAAASEAKDRLRAKAGFKDADERMRNGGRT